MPGRIEGLTETGIIADMRAELARLRRGFTSAQVPVWEYQDWVLTGTPPAPTYTLTYLPYGINHVSLNGLTAREGTDYTMDYSTGILTFAATKTAGDVLSISYVTTGDLTAASGATDTGKAFNVASTATATSSTIAVTVSSSTQVGDLMIFAAAGYGSSGITADPSGWTRVDVARGTSSIAVDVGVWWRIATSGDIGAISSAATFPNFDQHVGTILCYSGFTGVRAFSLSAGSAGAGATIATPTVSATAGDSVISLWAGEGDSGTAPTFGIDAACASRANVAMGFPRLLLGDEVLGSTGTTASRTASVSGGGTVSWVTGQIAIY